MGLFASVKDFVKKLYQRPLVNTVSNYSYQTVAYALQQARVVPSVAHSMVNNAPTNTIVRHVLRIVGEDLLPLVFVTYANQFIQDYADAYLKEDPNYPLLSAKTALQTNLYILQAATWAYSIRKKTQLLVHTTIVTLEAPYLVNNPRRLPPSNVCREEGCSPLRFAQGAARDVVTFWATEVAISLISYAPIVGGTAASFLSVYHRGRYVLTYVLPELCNRHYVIYSENNSPIALSLGTVHFISSGVLNTTLEMSTGIPRVFYASTIDQLLLIIQMIVAAHLNLPEPKKDSKRTLLDPVLLYQHSIGFIFDVILLGLKEKIPRMLQHQESNSLKEFLKKLPWETILNVLKLIHSHPTAHIFLPKLLHSTNEFLADPIVASNWPELRLSIIKAVDTIQELHNSRAIRLSNFVPGITSSLVQTVSGMPKFVTTTLLQLLMDPDTIKFIRQCRSGLPMEEFTVIEGEDDGLMTLPHAMEEFTVIEGEDAAGLIADKATIRTSVSAPSNTMRHRFCADSSPNNNENGRCVVHTPTTHSPTNLN